MARQTNSITKGLLPGDLGNVNLVVYESALAASIEVSDRPCVLHKLHVHSTNNSAAFILIHDATSLPADTAVPRLAIEVGADGSADLPFPIVCENGCFVCTSSTNATKTIGSADCFFEALAETS